MKRIAIIEDDIGINNGIRLVLGENEYEFLQCFCLEDARNLPKVDLVILDINLPDGNGYDYLRELRKQSNLPVLVLTANDTEMDEVTGFQLGADDYVTKPFSLMVLRLRVERLLNEKMNSTVYQNGGLEFDFEHMIFRKDSDEIELSKTELRLLRFLVENEGHVVTRERLIEYVWQNQEFVEENALSVTIRRLRSKLDTNQETHIVTSYGVGYMWRW